MFWSADELLELQASAVVSKIDRARADKQFEDKLLPAIQMYCTDLATLDDETLMQLAHRMASTVMAYAFDIDPKTDSDESDSDSDSDLESSSSDSSYSSSFYTSSTMSFTVPPQKGMVPLADMLNADAGRCNARLYHEDDCLVVKSIAPIAAGQEVFNDYGELPRSALLRQYGYVTPGYAVYDVVEVVPYGIEFAMGLEPTYPDASNVALALDRRGLLQAGYDLVRAPPDTALTDRERLIAMVGRDLLRFIASLLAPLCDDRPYVRKFPLPPKQKIVPLPPPGEQFDTVARILLAVVTRRQWQYATSLTEDRALMRGGEALSRRHRMALEVRIGEKEILADVSQTLRRILRAEPSWTTVWGDDEVREPSRKKRRTG